MLGNDNLPKFNALISLGTIWWSIFTEMFVIDVFKKLSDVEVKPYVLESDDRMNQSHGLGERTFVLRAYVICYEESCIGNF